MNDELAIKVEGVYKDFKLPHEKADSIKSLFVNPFRGGGEDESQHALKDISLEIKKGEFFGIVGRNGSGKSTLLKILAGIYQPTKGKVQIDGKLVPFIELGVGFNPELTGRENVYLNGAMLGFSTKEVDKMYDDIVDFAELEKFMDQKLKNYSSGMQVRLAFSVAIKSEADILLVDEVLAVGDADFQRKCYDYFKSLKEDKVTVIFVTHSMDAVREYCDRVALIDTSRCKIVGSPEKVADEYLRLFAARSANEVESEEGAQESRWGEGGVKVKSIKLSENKKRLAIDVVLDAKETVADDLVLGLRIKKESVVLCGLTTENVSNLMDQRNKHYFRVDKQEKKRISFTFDNIFADGVYAIDATLRSRNGVTIYDNWDNCSTFRISGKGSRFLIGPKYEVTIKNNKVAVDE